MDDDRDSLGAPLAAADSRPSLEAGALMGLAFEAARKDFYRSEPERERRKEALRARAIGEGRDPDPIVSAYETEVARVANLAAEGKLPGSDSLPASDRPRGAPGAFPASSGRGTKPVVQLPGKYRDDGVHSTEVGTDAFARCAINALPPGTIYRKDFVLGEIVGLPGSRRFSPLSDHAMRLLIDRHVCLVRAGLQSGSTTRFSPCRRDDAALVIAGAPTSSRVRELKQMVNYPVLVPGFERARAGWNPEAGLFYDEPPDLEGLTPKLDDSLGVLRDLLVDFPFADEASRENAFGMMLTPLLRPALLGPVPFHLVQASLERTGKGKLIDAALGHAVLGDGVPLLQIGRKEEEREKRITSLILGGANAVHFDNIPGGEVLDSASLASLATAWPRWTGRILGVSKTPHLANTGVWVMSGNNVAATGEIVKRSVPIWLQPKDDHPERRSDFVHPDILAYAKRQRRRVLEALLGLVEGWKRAGSPGAEVVMGGFERWVACVGGALRQAGATQWMANYTRWVTSANEEQADAEVLVAAWADEHGSRRVTTSGLMPLVERTGAFRSILTQPTERGRLVALARKVLGQLADRPVRGWIVRRETSGSNAKYWLEESQA